MSDDPFPFNPPDPVSGEPGLPSDDPRTRRMLVALQNELGRTVRRRRRRRTAVRAATVLVLGIGATLIAVKSWVPAPSPERTTLVPAPVQPRQSVPQPEHTIASVTMPAPARQERIPDCTPDAHGAPAALDGVCLLSDEQLIAVLAEQSGESYGVIRVGRDVQVIKNIQ